MSYGRNPARQNPGFRTADRRTDLRDAVYAAGLRGGTATHEQVIHELRARVPT
jgi:hypothetical protein